MYSLPRAIRNAALDRLGGNARRQCLLTGHEPVLCGGGGGNPAVHPISVGMSTDRKRVFSEVW
jgi:hypothetical protein